jgi:hypothetical protein
MKKYLHEYLQGKNIHNVSHKAGDSPIWHDLVKIKQIYMRGREVVFNSRNKARLWKDCWVNNQPLCAIAPDLYDICEDKEIMVMKVKECNYFCPSEDGCKVINC